MKEVFDRVRTLEAALQGCLEYLWADFGDAKRHAIIPPQVDNVDRWSIRMLDIADRIIELTKIVGPTDWSKVNVDILLDGWWEAVYVRGEMSVPEFDRERAEKVRNEINTQVSSQHHI